MRLIGPCRKRSLFFLSTVRGPRVGWARGFERRRVLGGIVEAPQDLMGGRPLHRCARHRWYQPANLLLGQILAEIRPRFPTDGLLHQRSTEVVRTRSDLRPDPNRDSPARAPPPFLLRSTSCLLSGLVGNAAQIAQLRYNYRLFLGCFQ